MKPYLLLLVTAAALSLTACHRRHHHRPDLALAKGPKHSPTTVDLTSFAQKVNNLYYTERHPRSISQTMDLYLPLDKSVKPPYPVIIWIHGGSWLYGDKNMDCIACRLFARRYAVASVNYRFTNEAVFPAQINDMKAAVRFLRANAKRYKLDRNRIGVWGASAGGHLAALLGTSGDVKALEGNLGYKNESSRVQAVVDWCGPTDFNTAPVQAGPKNKFRFEGAGSAVYNLMGGHMDKASLAAASPVTYASKDDPPFLIMHGDQDDAVPAAQSAQLYEALKRARVDASYQLLTGYGHAFAAPEHYKLVENFFDRTLGKSQTKK